MDLNGEIQKNNSVMNSKESFPILVAVVPDRAMLTNLKHSTVVMVAVTANMNELMLKNQIRIHRQKPAM